MKRVFIDWEKCQGCKNCVLYCMVEKHQNASCLLELKLTDKKTESRNAVTLKSKEQQPVPLICRHCHEPECVNNCISGAMTKDDRSVVNHAADKCVACYMCVMSCPYGVLKPSADENVKVLKCDRCADGKEELPACVRGCVTGALYMEEVDKVT